MRIRKICLYYVNREVKNYRNNFNINFIIVYVLESLEYFE